MVVATRRAVSLPPSGTEVPSELKLTLQLGSNWFKPALQEGCSAVLGARDRQLPPSTHRHQPNPQAQRRSSARRRCRWKVQAPTAVSIPNSAAATGPAPNASA